MHPQWHITVESQPTTYIKIYNLILLADKKIPPSSTKAGTLTAKENVPQRLKRIQNPKERWWLQQGTRVCHFQIPSGSATNSVQDWSYVSLCFSFFIHPVKTLVSSANTGARGVLICAHQIHGNLPAELALQGQPLEPFSCHMPDVANLAEADMGHKMGWPVLPCLQTSVTA